MTDTHGPARQLVERAYDALHGDPYSNQWRRELCADAAAHDAAFAALVEAAEALNRFNDDWDLPSLLDEPVEFGFIAGDLFRQLRAALEAAKGGNNE